MDEFQGYYPIVYFPYRTLHLGKIEGQVEIDERIEKFRIGLHKHLNRHYLMPDNHEGFCLQKEVKAWEYETVFVKFTDGKMRWSKICTSIYKD